MNRILRLYVIREVALPMLLTMMTLIFILVIGQVYRLITFLMQPSVSFFQVAEALASFIPSLLVLAIPMAILIGVLIGVGRMGLDREILATRASGINLFWVFMPMIFLGLLASLGIMALNSSFIPRMLQHSFNSVARMQLALVTALEPGQFHDPKELGGSNNFEFYFHERDPKDPRVMKGILIKLEQDTDAAVQAKKAEEKAEKEREKSRESSPLAGIVSSSTLARADAGLASVAAPKAADAPTSAPVRENQLTLITAASGTIGERMLDETTKERGKDMQRNEIVLDMVNGTFHQLDPDPESRTYTVGHFDRARKTLFGLTEMKKKQKTMTNGELRVLAAEHDERTRGTARKELAQRYSISLASFVFVLIGIPLAIWVRPSGKSWGILLAVGLMLVYYVLMQLGLSQIEYGKPLGYFVTFSPNLLFLVLGVGLWRHAVRG